MSTSVEITPRGRITLVFLHLTAGAAWLTGDGNAQLAASMIAAPFLVDWLHKLFLRPRLRIAPRTARTHAGQPFVEKLSITNVSGRPAREFTLVEPRYSTPAGGAWVGSVPPHAERSVSVAARSRRRSVATQRTFVVECLFPLGLFRWRAELREDRELVIEPNRRTLPSEVLNVLEQAEDEPNAGDRRLDAEFFSMREFRPGDDARRIHAAKSASTGILVVRELRGRRHPDCRVILDLRTQPGLPRPLGGRLFERAMSITASLTDEFRRQDRSFRCTVIGDDFADWTIDGARPAEEFLTFLAGARPVAYRPLTHDALTDLIGGDLCFWIAAGDHREDTLDALDLHLVDLEAAS